MAYIPNAASGIYSLGTEDKSTRQVPRVAIELPQHLPKFFLFAQKGDLKPHIVVGNERNRMYGDATFDWNSPYFNHATVFANLANAEGNSCVLQRVLPDDAGPPANIQVWIDVLPAQVPLYTRNADGSILLDAGGNKTPSGSSVAGYKVKFLTFAYSALETNGNTVGINDTSPNSGWGTHSSRTGTMLDALNNSSTMYPLFELKAPYQGSDGNNSGFRLWAPTANNTGNFPSKFMTENRVFPYYLSMIRRTNPLASSVTVPSMLGDQYLLTGFKPNTLDPVTTAKTYLGDIAIEEWQDLLNQDFPITYGNFGDIYIYQDSIETLLGMFIAAETAAGMETWHDHRAANGASDKFLFNFISGVSSLNIPYKSYQILTVNDSNGQNAVKLSGSPDLFASYGSDGTMTDVDVKDAQGVVLSRGFSSLVEDKMAEYADPLNPVAKDTARYPEQIFYDSGFPRLTKQELVKFISVRKDTYLVLSTYDATQPVLDASGEAALAKSLETFLQLYPESDYFGTQVMRASIVGFSGRLLNNPYGKRVPLSGDWLIKAARYMGAGNGKWKSGYAFDGAPGSIIDSMNDISVTWVNSVARNTFWSNGLSWAQPYDIRSFFFPAFRTVYFNDTSVLTSFPTAFAICTLVKILDAAWREFSGESNLSEAQLIERVNNFILDRVKGIFDNRFTTIPVTEITDIDAARGYSWTTRIEIYANPMKTVMTSYVQAFRSSDLATAQ